MSNKLSSTPQWKWLMQQQKGMSAPRRNETHYTGEVVEVPKEQFLFVDGHLSDNGHYPPEMRGKTFKVIGVGEAPNQALLLALNKERVLRKKEQNTENVDPGPEETIDSGHWKSGHWKVAKLILKRDLERADVQWMRTGSARTYRQYKLLLNFIEEKSRQNWDGDDDFATKYLTKYRRAYSDFANKRNDWSVRCIAADFLTEVRGMLCLPTYNKL